MNHRKQRRDQQFGDGADELWRLDLHRAIAGGQLGQQFEHVHLRQRAARLHAAILAHEIAQRAGQPGLGIETARLAFGQQQPRGDQPGPSMNLCLPVGCLGDMGIEPVGRLVQRGKRASAHRLVRQDQRRVDQPGKQPPASRLDLPRMALARRGEGIQPHAVDAQRGRLDLRTRAGAGQIAQPEIGMHRTLQRRGHPGAVLEVELGDRQLDPVDQEMPRPERNSCRPVARQRGRDGREHAALGRLRQGRGDQPPADAGCVGHADQPLARTHPRRADFLRNQRTRRGQNFNLRDIARRGRGFG